MIGGAKSGKSVFAESQIQSKYTSVCYIATQANQATDEETKHRILQHQSRRPKDWHTQEQYLNLYEYILENQSYDVYLIDCMTIWATNIFFDKLSQEVKKNSFESMDEYISHMNDEQIKTFENYLLLELKKIIQAVKQTKAEYWFITNEVGLSIVPENKLGRIFRDIQGKINQVLAEEANRVHLVIAGIELRIK